MALDCTLVDIDSMFYTSVQGTYFYQVIFGTKFKFSENQSTLWFHYSYWAPSIQLRSRHYAWIQLHIFLGQIVHCKAMLKSQEKLSANESAKNCRILPDRKNCNPFPKIQTLCLNSKCKHCLVLSFLKKLKTKPIYMTSRLSRALLPTYLH